VRLMVRFLHDCRVQVVARICDGNTTLCGYGGEELSEELWSCDARDVSHSDRTICLEVRCIANIVCFPALEQFSCQPPQSALHFAAVSSCLVHLEAVGFR